MGDGTSGKVFLVIAKNSKGKKSYALKRIKLKMKKVSVKVTCKKKGLVNELANIENGA